jgi:D-alanyl-D-alanine carboxypeptidase
VPTVTADAVTEPTLEADTPTATPVDPAASQLAAASVKLTPPAKAPEPQPETIVLASAETRSTNAAETAADSLEIVTRVSTSGGQEWGINVGSFPSRYNAERELLRTALVEMTTLNDALRKVSSSKGAFDANFVGMDQQSAELACRRLSARGTECTVLAPTVN